MNCPSEAFLLSAELGEMSPREAEQIQAHAQECMACRSLLEQHRMVLAVLRGPESTGRTLAADAAPFVAGVLAACSASDECDAHRRQRKKPLGKRGAWALAGVAAAVALLFALRQPWRQGNHSHGSDWIASRGNRGEPVSAVQVEVSVLREHTLLAPEGATLRPGDGIAVRYRNSRQEPRYLAVFIIDAARNVHWIHPAYLDARANPVSIPLPRTADGTLLDEIVEPESPAPGPMRIVSIVSDRPVSVKSVESVVSSGHEIPGWGLSSSIVTQWSCRWSNE